MVWRGNPPARYRGPCCRGWSVPPMAIHEAIFHCQGADRLRRSQTAARSSNATRPPYQILRSYSLSFPLYLSKRQPGVTSRRDKEGRQPRMTKGIFYMHTKSKNAFSSKKGQPDRHCRRRRSEEGVTYSWNRYFWVSTFNTAVLRVTATTRQKRQGHLLTLPPDSSENAVYFRNLLLIAARPTRPGPKRRSAPGRGTEELLNCVTRPNCSNPVPKSWARLESVPKFPFIASNQPV